jgi:pyruvate kinase
MPKDKVGLDEMIAEVESLRKAAKKIEKEYAGQLKKVHPSFRKSAINLLHYLSLRHHDLAPLQARLEQLGVSRLAKAESHVMASLIAVENTLRAIRGSEVQVFDKSALSIKKGKKLFSTNTTALLGKKLKGSRARIMVTVPTEAAASKRFVYGLATGGMNTARVNCAHDDPATWKRMIDNIRAAKRKTGRTCRVCMDLGGPKLRTGEMIPGPQVVHLHPNRDDLGRVVAPITVWIAPIGTTSGPEGIQHIPLTVTDMKDMATGDELRFVDARGKRRTFLLGEQRGEGMLATCNESFFLTAETALESSNGSRTEPISVGSLPPVEQRLVLRQGDALIIHRDPTAGEPAQIDQTGQVVKPAHISCTLPSVFEDAKIGEPIVFDDGKIEGVIREVSDAELRVGITNAKGGVAKLGADKGINLPESRLRTDALTAKDKEDLRFVCEHADVVNMSFVNSPKDVFDLLRELEQHNAGHLGIILKIETQRGFNNLPAILLAAMRHHPMGVMIARGDLAVEVGWRDLAPAQEEILRMCEAAHIPIVWATQVLESLAKKGRPSRAEITDASMAQRAECVMLNKGPHIVETIGMLEKILKSMERYHQKQAPILPPITTKELLKVH